MNAKGQIVGGGGILTMKGSLSFGYLSSWLLIFDLQGKCKNIPVLKHWLVSNIFFVFFVPCELFYILGTRGESKTWALVPCVWRSKRSLQSPEIRHQSQKWGIGSNVGLLIQPDSEHILSSFLLRASIRQQERNIHPKSRRGHQQMRDAKAKD